MSKLETLISATGFDTYEQALTFIQEQREICDMADRACIPPQTPEEEKHRERLRDQLRVSFGNVEAQEAHKEILRLREEIERLKNEQGHQNPVVR